MRLSRAKAIRKHLRFYRIVYGIVPPYQVILDGNFIHMSLKVKMDIQERVKKLLLGGPVVLYVPRGVLSELRALGEACKAALEWAEACCQVLEPEEGEEHATGTDAIKALIGSENSGKYMVATQDADLRGYLRGVASVGLLFVARAVLLMEPPSTSSKNTGNKLEKEKWRELAPEERELLTKVNKRQPTTSLSTDSTAAQPIKVRAKKRAKGPNPLSVLKAKKGDSKESQGQDKKKRIRKKKGKGTAAATAEGAAT